MPLPGEPAHEHLQFDALCAEVDEFENLPEPQVRPSAVAREIDDDETVLDRQILGGLVSPL